MKYRFLIAFICLCTFFSVSYSQDILLLKTGDEIKVKVVEVLPDLVKYKKWDNQGGPSYSEYKSKIFMIKYQNGTKDVFNEPTTQQSSNQQVNPEEEKKSLAVKTLENFFVTGFKPGKGSSFQLLDFKKTNGVLRNVYGQSIYEISFDLTVQTLRDGWMKGNAAEGYWKNNFSTYPTKPDLSKSGESYMYDVKFFPKGSVYIVNCVGEMVSTDNGYKYSKHQIKTVREIGQKPLQQMYTPGSSEQNNTTYSPPPIVNKPVDYKSYLGYLTIDNSGLIIKIVDISIDDEEGNISEAQTKIIESLTNMKRLGKENNSNFSSSDTLNMNISIKYSYRYRSTVSGIGYFSDCIIGIQLKNKTSTLTYKNIYTLSNYGLLAKGFASKLEANRSLIANNFNQTLSQFIIGNFPLSGEIIEVTEKNKKQDEAKMVKINLGRKDGLFVGYLFVVTDFSNSSTKADIIVKEVFDNYSLCKVQENEKKIFENLIAGKKLKIKTNYKP